MQELGQILTSVYQRDKTCALYLDMKQRFGKSMGLLFSYFIRAATVFLIPRPRRLCYIQDNMFLLIHPLRDKMEYQKVSSNMEHVINTLHRKKKSCNISRSTSNRDADEIRKLKSVEQNK